MNTPTRQNQLVISHSALFFAVSISAWTAAFLIGAGTPTLHMLLLVFVLPISGIPHGALDYYLAWKTFGHRLGRYWALWFVAVYLIIMSGVIAVWMIAPLWSLLAFLLLTLYHFGTGDVIPIRQTPVTIRIAEIIARGGMVITFPALIARPDVILLFSYLVPESGAVVLAGILAKLAPFTSACVLLTAGWSLFEFMRFRNPISLGRVAELLVTALIFLQLPPLLAFTLYFSVMHSLRHMLAVTDGNPAGSLFVHLVGAFWVAMPITVVTIIIGAAVYLLLSGLSFEMTQLMRVVFIGIASMTYPHVVLVDVAKHLGIIHSRKRKKHAGRTRVLPAPRKALMNAKP